MRVGARRPHTRRSSARVRAVCRHEKVDRSFGFLNDKVNGVHTGVQLASEEKVILADDDIRYGRPEIDRVCKLLDHFEVVRTNFYPLMVLRRTGNTITKRAFCLQLLLTAFTTL